MKIPMAASPHNNAETMKMIARNVSLSVVMTSVTEAINFSEIKMSLLDENVVYKPFRYPWCYDAWLTQQRVIDPEKFH